MYSKYQKQEFPDGEIEIYYFANNNTVTLCTVKWNSKYKTEIGWNFKTTKKEAFIDMLSSEFTTYYRTKLNAINELYKSLTKQKFKSKETKLLIASLLIINHDIKEKMHQQQKLF